MLLSINPEKIREQLATPAAYTVTSSNLETQSVIHYEPVSVQVYSATMVTPIDMERARERLLLLQHGVRCLLKHK
jgi:hypothetical protein